MNKRTWTVFLIAVACAAGGACRWGNEATFGQQIKGKQVIVQLSIIKAGDWEIPSVNVWNNTDQPISVHPIKLQGWYKGGGTEESATEEGSKPLPPNSAYIFAGRWPSRQGECLERVRVEVSTGGEGEAFTFHRGEACP